MKLAVLFVLSALVCSGAANAQLLVGVDEPTDYVYLINVKTNTATPLFTGYEVWGMAADNDNRVIYFNDGVDLYRVPYGTLVPEYIGPVMYEGASQAVVSLAFNPNTGKLYATKNIATEAVYEIDPATGQADLLFAYNTAFDFGGIDCLPGTGTLYGLNDSSTGGEGQGLYKIDPFGQTTTFVVAYPAGESDIDGLGTGGGKAYFVIDQPGSIYVYNLHTNAFEDPLTSPFAGSEIFSAGAWAPGLVPEPAVLSVLALGLLGLLKRRTS